jgi:hypothetical protein
MARTLTPEETQQEYVAAMGAELGSVFFRLYNEFAWLHLRWHQFRVLFGTKPERVRLLNAAAGLLFRLVQDSRWEDTLLHISRITDKVDTGGRPNLTIRLLPGLVTDSTLAAALQESVSDAVTKTEFARDWRNRRIAHADLALAMKEGAKPLAQASRQDVEGALAAVGNVLNQLESYYKHGTVYFKPFGDPGDAESLLYVIRDGLEAETARRERVQTGRALESDLGPPRAV